MRELLRDKVIAAYVAGLLIGTLVGVLVTQAYWGVGLFR